MSHLLEQHYGDNLALEWFDYFYTMNFTCPFWFERSRKTRIERESEKQKQRDSTNGSSYPMC